MSSERKEAKKKWNFLGKETLVVSRKEEETLREGNLLSQKDQSFCPPKERRTKSSQREQDEIVLDDHIFVKKQDKLFKHSLIKKFSSPTEENDHILPLPPSHLKDWEVGVGSHTLPLLPEEETEHIQMLFSPKSHAANPNPNCKNDPDKWHFLQYSLPSGHWVSVARSSDLEDVQEEENEKNSIRTRFVMEMEEDLSEEFCEKRKFDWVEEFLISEQEEELF